jgi:hypothetical protein
MAIIDLFSKRKARIAKADQADIFQYEVLPERFRVQVVHIWRDAIGNPQRHAVQTRWEEIEKLIAREKGLFLLGKDFHDAPCSMPELVPKL